MRFLHVADTHVGYAALSRVDDRGLNQREQDVFAAFGSVVDLAIAERVDFVLHAGDVFDSVRPSNRAVAFVMEELSRSVRAGVPWFLIAGNHESPRLRETGSVLRFLDFVPGVEAAYRGVPEKASVGDVDVHLVPHAPDSEALRAAVEGLRFDPARRNVVALHCGVHGVDRFGDSEFNEVVLPASALRPDADYVALGHYHRHLEVTPNAAYAGSTERTSVREARDAKGVVLVDLETGRREFRPIPTRRFLDLDPVDARDAPEAALQAAVERALLEANLDGAVVRLRLRGVTRGAAAALDRAALRRITASALHFALEVEVEGDPAASVSGSGIGPLPAEWTEFASSVPGAERESVRERGLRLLEEASRA